MDTEAIDQAVEVLNRIHKADPSVLDSLIRYRVPCNEELANDPTVQVRVHHEVTDVGILGIINGLFGVDENNWGYIYANFNGMGYLENFTRGRPEE